MKTRSIRWCILVCTFCFPYFGLSVIVDGQVLESFRHISTSDNFSLNPVTAIDQDSLGQLWFATQTGLMRHDGLNFRRMTVERDDVSSREANDLRTLEITEDGNIWTGSSAGVFIYDPRRNDFRNLGQAVPAGHPLFTAPINHILQTRNDEIWIASNVGLFRSNAAGSVIETVWITDDSTSLLGFLTIYESLDGRVWAGTDQGLFLVDKQEVNVRLLPVSLGTDPSESTLVNSITEGPKGKLWVGTSAGLFALNTDSREVRPHHLGKRGTDENFVRALAFDARGRLWAGTLYGIVVIDTGGEQRRIVHDSKKVNSLRNNKVRALFADRDATIWISSFYGGINTWNQRQLKFGMLDEVLGNQISNKVISTIVEQDNGKIYLGTDGEGVLRYDPVADRVTQINELPGGAAIGTVKRLLFISTGELLIGTQSKGLLLHQPTTGRILTIQTSGEAGDRRETGPILSMAEDAYGTVWIGTIDGRLLRFEPSTRRLVGVKYISPEEGRSGRAAIRVLNSGTSGDLYIGTNRYVSRISRQELSQAEPSPNILKISDASDPLIYVEDIVEDRAGNIWVATLNRGLLHVEKDSLVSVPINEENSVFSVVPATDGLLWMSTKGGIIRYDPGNYAYRRFDARNGVQPNEFSYDAGLLSARGRMYFGGASGVTIFSPAEIGHSDNYAPDVVITRFSLMDKMVTVGDETKLLDRAIEYTDELHLGYRQNSFSLDFVMPNYVHTPRHTYYYRLRGLDVGWTRTNVPTASYTIQQGGQYVFEVRAENSDGKATAGTTRLVIYLDAPPWKTWWAYVGYSLIVLAAMWGIFVAYRSNLRLQYNLELETREVARQKQLSQQKLRFFTNISHDLRTPLTLISGSLESILADFRGRTPFLQRLLNVRRNTDVLSRLINEFMELARLEGGELKINAVCGELMAVIREVFRSFEDQATVGGYAYRLDTELETCFATFDREQLEKILFNLLANAFKFTPPGGSVNLEVGVKGSMVMISVVDTGDGISTEELEAIFERFYEVPGRKSYNNFSNGAGIGLAIAKKIIDLHGGRLEVGSSPGDGSTFTAWLPVSPDQTIADNSEKTRHPLTVPATVAEPSAGTLATGMPREIASREEKILVVEDNPEVSALLHDVLSPHYLVILAHDGLEGAKLAITEQPQLIISDVMMPGLDGIQLCARVKGDMKTSHIPFVMLTAKASPDSRIEGLHSGADDYLTKPFNVRETLLKCRNILNTRKRLSEKLLRKGAAPAASGERDETPDERLMRHAAKIVRDNIANENFSISDLCGQLGIGRSLLFLKFRAWVDQTPKEYILTVRMKYAAELIERGKSNFAEIAYQVGFKDPSYFSKTFKKHFEVTPTQYAQRFNEDFGTV